MLSRRGVAVLATALITLAACGGGTATPSASPSTSASASAVTAEKPTRPVEFVISTAPGGGSDTYARIMQGVIE